MKKYLLDSNTISDLYDKFSDDHIKIIDKLSALKEMDKVYISILSIYEFEYGYANAPTEKKSIVQKKIEEAQQDFEVLPLSKEGAQLFGILKKKIKDLKNLNKEAIKKHNIDIMLAATAIVEDCILVSADSIYLDIQQFESKLILENWVS
jgi:predicted nucleic acid-binding protein